MQTDLAMESAAPRSSGPIAAIIVLLPLAIIASIGVGLLLWAVEHYLSFYLIIAFPAIAGGIVGFIMSLAVRLFKIRAGLFVTVVGLIAGIVIYGTYHFATYYFTFRGEARQVLVEQTGNSAPTEAEVTEFSDAVLSSEVNEKGILGYLQLSAREGMTITRATSSSDSGGIALQGTLA